MTIEEARALIPPGWVECDIDAFAYADTSWRIMLDKKHYIYAIPAPDALELVEVVE